MYPWQQQDGVWSNISHPGTSESTPEWSHSALTVQTALAHVLRSLCCCRRVRIKYPNVSTKYRVVTSVGLNRWHKHVTCEHESPKGFIYCCWCVMTAFALIRGNHWRSTQTRRATPLGLFCTSCSSLTSTLHRACPDEEESVSYLHLTQLVHMYR